MRFSPLRVGFKDGLHKQIQSKCGSPPKSSLILKFMVRNKQVCVVGHVSRPVFGEGRQAPDRQMFFVNSRPCSLPQVAKVFNEVYKSYNLSQSPFVFANIILDTSTYINPKSMSLADGQDAYDVNVSPDKRTIFLHDQNTLLETLKVR